MKKMILSSVILCMAVFYTAAQTGKKAAAKAKDKTNVKSRALVMKNLIDSFSYAAGFNVATNMKAQGISRVNVAIMQIAIDDVFKNNSPVLNAETVNSCIQKQLQIFSSEQSLAEKAKGEAFLETNKKRKEVITLPEGLQYEVIKNGDVNGMHPTPVDTVVVNYIGTFVDGNEFDNSYKKGKPAAFPLTGVIKGWTEILQLMKPGDHWKVYIPTDLGYGAGGYGNSIPPNAVLVFEMVLESIRPAGNVETPKNGQ